MVILFKNPVFFLERPIRNLREFVLKC